MPAEIGLIEALIERAQAVKEWLEVASACKCSTLDVCALFDDRALGLPARSTNGDGIDGLSLIAVPPRRPRNDHERG